jgi:hypothetical protein
VGWLVHDPRGGKALDHFLAAASRLRLTAMAAFTSAVGDRIATSRTFPLKP